MHGSLVTSSLIRETTENESANEGYRFGKSNPIPNPFALKILHIEKSHVPSSSSFIIPKHTQTKKKAKP
jgi:hypothetical protein